jgi:hypothetical protein
MTREQIAEMFREAVNEAIGHDSRMVWPCDLERADRILAALSAPPQQGEPSEVARKALSRARDHFLSERMRHEDGERPALAAVYAEMCTGLDEIAGRVGLVNPLAPIINPLSADAPIDNPAAPQESERERLREALRWLMRLQPGHPDSTCGLPGRAICPVCQALPGEFDYPGVSTARALSTEQKEG